MNYLCDDPEFWRRKEERESKPATPLFIRDVKPAGIEGVVELPAAWANAYRHRATHEPNQSSLFRPFGWVSAFAARLA